MGDEAWLARGLADRIYLGKGYLRHETFDGRRSVTPSPTNSTNNREFAATDFMEAPTVMCVDGWLN